MSDNHTVAFIIGSLFITILVLGSLAMWCNRIETSEMVKQGYVWQPSQQGRWVKPVEGGE